MTCVPVVISGDDSGTTTDEYQIKTMALTRRKSSGVGRGKRRQQQNNPAEGNDEEKKSCSVRWLSTLATAKHWMDPAAVVAIHW